MRLAKSIMLKRNNSGIVVKIFFSVACFFMLQSAVAQGNSPYSRYGLGDAVPNTNILNRGMGGIQAGYSDFLSINFNNPASYSQFQSFLEARTKKQVSGRVLLEAGINVEGQTLRNPNTTAKFNSTNSYFSYLQLGVPLRKNWGLSFGLRPLSRIGYSIITRERLTDPRNGSFIDSAQTEYTGDGGAYIPSIGTGFSIKNFSAGVNIGYLFGKREAATRRALTSRELPSNNANTTVLSSFGGIYFNLGAQYKIHIDSSATKATSLTLGATGNIKQTLNGTQDFINETFIRDGQSGDFRLDSVYENKDVKGEVTYPASYTIGFVLDQRNPRNAAGWLIGVDFIQNKWEDFRFFGAGDAVKNNWQVRAGGQLRPKPARNYFSNVAYRAGFYTGPDYITAGGNLPTWGASFGLGLPLANYNRLTNQATFINLALEYAKRGNDDNPVKENTFRFSVGLNFSDLWFNKRKYD
jgi:hypothetical protein